MEYRHWSRMGENARIFAFLPDALISGTAKPTLKLFNTIVFLAALLLLFLTFYKHNQALLGIVVCLLVLATPFYQYAIFRQKNIFALLASVYLLISAINVKFIFSENSSKWNFIFPLISGILIGFFTEIRGEIIVVFVTALIYYMFAGGQKIVVRFLLIILLVLSFLSTRNSIRKYFDNKYDETMQLVIEKNGHPYNGKRASAHSFWHPVFCGLGDFDTKYGYKWNDTVAYQYAIPFLIQNYNINLPYSGKYHFDAYYDSDSLYYIKFEEFPVYESIIKVKVLNDIKSDPIWFLSIISKRIVRIFSNTLPIPLVGWLFIPLLLFLIIKSRWRLLLFLVASLPLSLTPLLFFSGGNSTYNSIFPIIALSIIASLFYEKIKNSNESTKSQS